MQEQHTAVLLLEIGILRHLQFLHSHYTLPYSSFPLSPSLSLSCSASNLKYHGTWFLGQGKAGGGGQRSTPETSLQRQCSNICFKQLLDLTLTKRVRKLKGAGNSHREAGKKAEKSRREIREGIFRKREKGERNQRNPISVWLHFSIFVCPKNIWVTVQCHTAKHYLQETARNTIRAGYISFMISSIIVARLIQIILDGNA